MLLEAGVDVMLHTQFAAAIVEENSIRGVIVESKSGRQAILARLVVDCTGDGDVAYRAGAPCEKGNDEGGLQPPTMMFCLGGVDTEKLRMSICNEPERILRTSFPTSTSARTSNLSWSACGNKFWRRKPQGYSIPTGRTILITGLRQGEVWVNMTRVAGTDGTDLAVSRLAKPRDVVKLTDIHRYLVDYVPGFEQAFFTKTAPFLGIRETRRIVGDYVLNRDDVLGCRRFEDAIAVASYPIDIHRPGDNDCTLEWCGDCYDIPVPLLVAPQNRTLAGGRPLYFHDARGDGGNSRDGHVHGDGGSGGPRSGQAVRDGVTPRRVDVGRLQRSLLAHDAYLRT